MSSELLTADWMLARLLLYQEVSLLSVVSQYEH
jgi:hypothetical protein